MRTVYCISYLELPCCGLSRFGGGIAATRKVLGKEARPFCSLIHVGLHQGEGSEAHTIAFHIMSPSGAQSSGTPGDTPTILRAHASFFLELPYTRIRNAFDYGAILILSCPASDPSLRRPPPFYPIAYAS